MHLKNAKPAFYALLILMSSILATEAQGQTITFTIPSRDRVVLTGISTISGTVTGSNIAAVKISLGKAEADEEWAYDSRRNAYRWTTGPTGQWLLTRLTGTTWTAPSGYSLPSGADLPNGNYVIYAQAFNSMGRPLGTQFRRGFTIRR